MAVYARIFTVNTFCLSNNKRLEITVYGVYGAIFTLGISGVVQVVLSFYYLKKLGLSVDFIIRADDVRYFFALAKIAYRRLLSARGHS